MPIPQSVEASTQNSIGEGGGGLCRRDPAKLANKCSRHQDISVRTLIFGSLRRNGEDELSKEVMKRDKDGKRDRPSGKAREQCTKVPKTDWASRKVNLLPGTQFAILIKYFDFLSGGICTDLLDRSQRKPRYLKIGAKGRVFECFQGHPRGVVISKMSLRE
jgi:hypothetical protein